MKLGFYAVYRSILMISGVTAIAIGAAKSFLPNAFYDFYETLGMDDPSSLNEMNSTSLTIFVAGVFMVTGAVKSSYLRLAAIVGTIGYLSVAASRMVTIAITELPNANLMQALIFELIFGVALLVLAWLEKALPARQHAV